MKLCLAVVFDGVASSWAMLARLAGHPTSHPVVVLMYHSVKPAETARFERQMDQLNRFATPVPADFRNERRESGRHYVAVTFDDGYRSIVDNAIPLMLARSIPAAVFIPTKYLGGRPGWITDRASRDRDETLLTADEVKRLRQIGVLIGSHSVTHRPLAELSRAEVVAELSESREMLTTLLQEQVNLFALPYGSSSPDVLQLCKEANYSRVFLGDPVWSLARTEPHAAGRITVSPTDWPLEFRLKVRGAYRWLPLAITAKRRLLGLVSGVQFWKTRRRSARVGL